MDDAGDLEGLGGLGVRYMTMCALAAAVGKHPTGRPIQWN